jgi:sugar phosphate isomerase/epimerase
VKVGLYSITYLGIWYRGGPLSMRDFIVQARKLGYQGIEIDGKRPHGNPMDLSAAARSEIRAMTAGENLEIPAVASNNDFSSPIPEHRECQLLMVREQIRLAADLGAKVVRLFLAWPGVTIRDGLAQYDVARSRWDQIWRDTTRVEVWDYARSAFREAARMAKDHGVVLALQNHAPVIRHYRDVLHMVAEVDSPAFRACIDVPIEPNQDDDYVRRMALETGALEVHSHFGGEFERDVTGKVVQRNLRWPQPVTNYPTFVRGLKDAGYEGWFCFEYCHPAMNARHEPQGREFVDEQAALALEYMRTLLAEEGVLSR